MKQPSSFQQAKVKERNTKLERICYRNLWLWLLSTLLLVNLTILLRHFSNAAQYLRGI